MCGEEGLGEDVVESEDAQEGDDDGLVHRSAHPLRASGRSHPLVTGDDRDDAAEERGLDHRAPEVGDGGVVEQRGEKRPERRVEGQRGQHAAQDSEDQRVDVEEARDDHQREEPRDDQVLDRVDAEHLKRVELLADLARAEVRGDRRAADAGKDDRRGDRPELPHRAEHEEAAQPVDRAEDHEEVAGLEAGRAVAEADRGDQERQPAELEHEQELLDELGAVGVRRPHRGDQRLPGEDHHVPDLLEQVLGGKEDAIGGCSDHEYRCNSTPARESARPNRPNVLFHWYSVLQMSDTLPADFDLAVNRDGELPVGTQLVWKLRSLIDSGALEPGDRLPSVRTLAEAAGVNVNTARAVYGRLERAGLIRSEQGRGTFVTPQAPLADPESRGDLVRQIAELEAQLLRRPAAGEPSPARLKGGRLTTTDELRDIRDGLSARL